MSDTIELTAEIRTTVGKGASRRLRRLEDKVPAIIYGGSADAQMLTLSANELGKAMQLEAFYSQILNVTIGGKTEQAVVRDLQRNPANERVQHIDFQRVSADRRDQRQRAAALHQRRKLCRREDAGWYVNSHPDRSGDLLLAG